MLTNVFSFENGQLLQIDDLIARIPARKPSGPTVDDPIGNVIITLSTDVMLLLIDASGDLSTLDHYEIVAYSEDGQPVKTVNIGKLTEYEMTSLDKEIPEGNYTIECTAVSVYGNTSKKSNSIEYTVLPAPKAMTLRFAFSQKDYNPETAGVGSAGTWTKVDSPTLNIWDWTNPNPSWATAFGGGNTTTPGAFADYDTNRVSVIASGDTTALTNASRLFQNCYAITDVCDIYTGNATTVMTMFSHCENATRLPGLDLTSCTDPRAIYQHCHSMKNIPTLIMPTVKCNFQALFAYCYDMEGDISIDFNNKASVLAQVFRECHKLKHITVQNTQGATAAPLMFSNCHAVETISVFDTSQCTDITGMFRDCYNLKEIPFIDTSKADNMSHFAHRCYSITNFPALNTSSCIKMDRLASNCIKLTEFPLIDTSSAKIMSSILSGHGGSYEIDKPMYLKSIPDFDYSSATTIEDAFGNNLALETLPVINAPHVTDTRHIFMNCRNVKNGIVDAYNALKESIDQSADHSLAFSNCGIDTEEGRAALAQVPQSWGGLAED